MKTRTRERLRQKNQNSPHGNCEEYDTGKQCRLCKEKKVKMAVNRRPPFRLLPEVSSAPSWFEFSSFLLTFAAEADMFSQAGGDLQTSERISGRFEAGFSLSRRALIRRKVRRAEANNVLLFYTMYPPKSARAPLSPRTRRAECSREEPSPAEPSRAPPLKVGLTTRLQFDIFFPLLVF